MSGLPEPRPLGQERALTARALRASFGPMTLAPDRSVEDSRPRSFVERAPAPLRPYLRLARYDRPVGFWLLAIPCWIGIALGRLGGGWSWSDAGLAALMGVGAIAMRGAGCTYNDLIDRDLDRQVARTANRPLAAGTITLKAAWAFLLMQCLVGLGVLLALPPTAQLVALGALPLVAAYPFMKRITWFPQAWLGLTFNWGALVGFVATSGQPLAAGLLVYAGLAVWTFGYDTIYAGQDVEDDALVGVKSTARFFGAHARFAVGLSYGVSVILITLGTILAGGYVPIALAGPALFAAALAWQVVRVDFGDTTSCLSHFKANQWAGLLLAAGFTVAPFTGPLIAP